MSSSHIILLIIEQLRLPCSSWSSYCNILYPRSLLYLSQWELAKLYWCVVWQGLGAWWLPCHYMTSLSFIAASCRLLWLRHRANFTAAWAAAATSISSYIFIVASDTTPTLLWDYAAMKAVWDHTRSFLRHHADFDCGIMPTLLRHHCQLDSSSHRTTCGVIAVLIFIVASEATSTPLLWDHASMKAAWDHTRSFLRHHADFDCGITADLIRHLVGQLAASSPSWIVVL
jgi:hypothetical protein